MQMTTYKRNFSKCKECVQLTAEVNAALKAHDPKQLQVAKDKRLAHYMLSRSDKLHYWQQRWQVCAVELEVLLEAVIHTLLHL